MDLDQNTSPSLLGRLQAMPLDQGAWEEFERHYGELIGRWCRRWGMQASDAEDIKQDVLLALANQMSRFRYDPNGRFRGWLKTVTYRAWCDFLQKRSRQRDLGSGDTGVMQLLDRQAVRADLFQEFESESERELLQAAMVRAQQRVQPHTWEAFRLLTQDGLSGAQVAERLQMKVGAVWVAKSKVQKTIQQEARRLDQEPRIPGIS